MMTLYIPLENNIEVVEQAGNIYIWLVKRKVNWRELNVKVWL